MDPLSLITMLIFCFEIKETNDISASLYLQCGQVLHDTRKVITTEDEFLKIIKDNQPFVDDTIDALTKLYDNGYQDNILLNNYHNIIK